MASLSNGQAIILCCCGYYLSSSSIFSSLILSGRRFDVYHTSTWCGLSANLECRSEMCCMWLAENTGRKKIAKNSASAHHRTNLSGYIFTTKECIENRKKNLLNSNISSRRFHNMVNVGPLTAETGLGVWGTPANFNDFHVLASLLHQCCATEVNQTLHDVWPSSGLVHYI